MTKPIHILLLSACAAAPVLAEFADTRTIEEGLREDPAVLVNSQGLAQQDLSVRGSGYSGAGISVNGLNLKVPYSGHFNAELPMPGNLLGTPAATTGLGNISGHLVGTAAYTTAPLADGGQVHAGIGTKEHYSGGVSVFSSGVGGFLDWEKALRVDYGANDYDRYAGGANVQLEQNDWLIDLIGSYQYKEFGAQGYYGIPSAVYAEDRFQDTLFLGSAVRGDLDDSYIRASASWHQFDDKYRLPIFGFTSEVRSRHSAVAVEGRTMEIQNIALNLRADFESEEIDQDLGSHNRTGGSVLVMPELRLERVTLKAGINSVFQSSETTEWLPQAGIDWFVTDNSIVYLAYSENVQRPDYQMLRYTDPFHRSNRFLELQHSKNTELGFRQYVSQNLDWRAAAFYRRTEHAVDWMKDSVADIAWAATDLGNLDTIGIESEINYYPSDDLNLRLFYQWIDQDDYDYYAGLYTLDYAEHQLSFSGHWNFLPEFMLFAAQTLRYQTDNNSRNSSNFGADASVGLHWFPRFVHNTRLSFLVENLWNSNFQAIPGQKPRDPSVSTGITVTW